MTVLDRSELQASPLSDLHLIDIGDQPGGLPLLQTALLELWAVRRGSELHTLSTTARWAAFGGRLHAWPNAPTHSWMRPRRPRRGRS